MSGPTDLKFLLGLASGFLLFSLLAAFKKQIERAFDSLLSKVPLTVGKLLRYRKWSKKYQQIIYEEHRHLRYVGIKHSVTLNRPKLEDVYVNLELQAASRDEKISRAFTLNLNETLSLDIALKRFRHLVVLGHPGAGKTTLLEYMVCVACRTHGNSDRGIAGLLPIYVPLRRCSSLGKTFLDQLTDPTTRLLPPDLLKTYPPGFFESYLNKGKCLLLFDGLDEVLNEDEYVAAARMVETTAAIFPKCRVIVSSRLAGWRNLLGSQFTRFVIRDLSKREIAGLVNQWYLAVINEQVHDASKDSHRVTAARRIAHGHAEKMLAVLKSNPRLMQIAETPLILSLMCLVFYMRQDLPRKRAKLYEECIEILLEDWDRREKQMKVSGMPTLEKRVILLERIAVRLFENSVSELSKEELERVLEAAVDQLDCDLTPAELVRFIEERSGIISEKALGVYGFNHLTFQEFFAAKGISRSADGLQRLYERFKQAEIEEVVLLYAGIVERGDDLINLLLEEFDGRGDARFLVAAGKALGEARDISLPLKTRTLTSLNSAFDVTTDATLLTTLQSVLAEQGVTREVIRTFADYEITEELARGGMGTVYRARERGTGKAVALKVYTSGTARVLDKIQTEMSMLRTLDHPNLVQIVNLGKLNDQLFVAMELLNAPTLEELVGQFEQRMPFVLPSFGSDQYYRWAKQVFEELCCAVGYLHERGIIHGDIKPGNVIWTVAGVKLIDFGLDRLVLSHRDERISNEFIVATPNYLSPESLMGKAARGPTTDVFTMGKVLEVLWTLKRPSWRDNIAAIHNEKQYSQRVSIKQPRTPDEVSAAIIKIVRKATMGEARYRYQTVSQLLADFDMATRRYADYKRVKISYL